jgi:hypothetical protein
MSKLWPLFVLLLAAWMYLFETQFARAHDWYSSTADPVFQSNCCGGHDCAPVDPAWVSEVSEGYRLTMTANQARTVNPAAQFGAESRARPKPNIYSTLASMIGIVRRRVAA